MEKEIIFSIIGYALLFVMIMGSHIIGIKIGRLKEGSRVLGVFISKLMELEFKNGMDDKEIENNALKLEYLKEIQKEIFEKK